MIVDRIEEQERYYPLHPDMELAFAFLAEAPDLESGRYELEDGLFATVSEGDTVSARGFGKFELTEVGALTKKGRIPITVQCYK